MTLDHVSDWLEKRAAVARLIADNVRGVNMVNVKDTTGLFTGANLICGQDGWDSKSGLGCLRMCSKETCSAAVVVNLSCTAVLAAKLKGDLDINNNNMVMRLLSNT